MGLKHIAFKSALSAVNEVFELGKGWDELCSAEALAQAAKIVWLESVDSANAATEVLGTARDAAMIRPKENFVGVQLSAAAIDVDESTLGNDPSSAVRRSVSSMRRARKRASKTAKKVMMGPDIGTVVL